MEEQQARGPAKSIRGYKVVIIILAIILGALSYLFYAQTKQMRADFAVERDTLTNRITGLVSDYDNIRTVNDTLSREVQQQRGKADSLLHRLTTERSLSRQKIAAYEKELGTLRTVMRGFVQQIDSLNRLNTSLIGENIEIKKQIGEERLRADAAEEKAQELGTKVRKGSVIRARDIALHALGSSDKDKDVSRVSRATRLRIDFTLSGNDLAQPGQRNVYVRLTGPAGMILSLSPTNLFTFEGDQISYSATRSIDYQNQDLPVSLYYNGKDFTAGKYGVAVYMDGFLIGSSDIILK